MDKAAQRYLTRLRRALVCPKEDRERLLEDAGAMLENFAQENPKAFYKDYVASFGPPEVFAAEMLSNLDPEDVAEVRSQRRRARLGIGAVAAAILVLLVGFWFGRRSQSQPSAESPMPPAETTSDPSPGLTSEPTPEETEPTMPPEETASDPTPEPTAEETDPPGSGEAFGENYLEQLYTDSDQITHKEAVAALAKLGVFCGMSDGSFRPEGTITRAEMAKHITLIMQGGKDLVDPEKTEPSFTDTQDHWAEAYIEYCASLNIVSGKEDGSFCPEEEVSAIELIKMAELMLNYEADAYRLNEGDWMARVDELARTMEPSLYTGLMSVRMGQPVTRDDAAQILYNSLSATPRRIIPYVQPTDGTTSWQYTSAKREDSTPSTLLWERFGLDSTEDIFR